MWKLLLLLLLLKPLVLDNGSVHGFWRRGTSSLLTAGGRPMPFSPRRWLRERAPRTPCLPALDSYSPDNEPTGCVRVNERWKARDCRRNYFLSPFSPSDIECFAKLFLDKKYAQE